MTFQRFRGPQGVFQTIALLESCSKTRRQQLLDVMALENSGLAALVKTKVLTIDHVASWTSVELRKLSAELAPELRRRLFSVLIEANQSSKLKELGVPVDSKFATFASEEREALDLLIVLKARELERIGILEIWRFDPPKSMYDSQPQSKAA